MHSTLFITGLAAAVLAAGPVLAEIKVAATIKPVHSLVAAVMGDTGKPALLLDGPASPHVTALRPSQARIIEKSDIVFAIGEGFEAFLEKLMESHGGKRIVELAEAPGVTLLAYRNAGGHESAEDHGHGHGHGHGADDHGDEHGPVDPHMWLDPVNGKAMARHIAAVLSVVDPANAVSYEDNAKAVARDLDALERDLAARFAAVKDRAFLVFHDAYQYLEARFDLNGQGAIVLNPETPPGARRIQEIRHRIEEAGVACVFSEPQFEVGYVRTVLEGTQAGTASLDPLGVEVVPGPGAYRQMLTDLSDALAGCLAAH
jgi:zinc transport system substrate-binding protein